MKLAKTVLTAALLSPVMLFPSWSSWFRDNHYDFSSGANYSEQPKIGFIHLKKAIQSCRRSIELKKQLETKQKVYDEEKSKREKKLNAMLEVIKSLPNDSPLRQDKEEIYIGENQAYNYFVEKIKTELENTQKKNSMELYKKSSSLLKEIANKERYTMIIKADQPRIEDNEPLDVQLYEIDKTIVLFASETTDLTKLLISLLDKEFENPDITK